MLKNWTPFILIPLLFGCGNSHSDRSTDMKDYFPTNISQKNFLQINHNGNTSNKKTYTEILNESNNTLIYQINTTTIKTITIQDNEIIENNSEENPHTKHMKRYIGLGSKLFTLTQNIEENILFENIVLGKKNINSTKICHLESKITKLDNYTIPYSGDILKFKCIEKKTIVTNIKDDLPEYIDLKDGTVESDYDISYFYMKKGIGVIVRIDNNCYINKGEISTIDDTSKSCEKQTYNRHFYLN